MKRALTAAIALLLAPAPARAAAVDTTPPTLRSIQLSHVAITVAGLQVERLTVRVHLTDDVGVTAYEGDTMQRFLPAVLVGPRWVRLTLAEGTPADGIWSGIAPVTSDWVSGIHRPTYLHANDHRGNTVATDPRNLVLTPSVRVTSSALPAMTMTFAPDPATVGDTITQTVSVTNPWTGRPWRGVPVLIAWDNSCVEGEFFGRNGITDTSGRLSRKLQRPGGDDLLHCAWIDGEDVPGQPDVRISSAWGTIMWRWTVTARPAATSAPAGTDVAVTGTLAPKAIEGIGLQLQRRYSDGVWRTVGRGSTDRDTNFRLVATPPAVGTHSYRVLAPAWGNRVPGTSPVFTIRGT